MVNGKRWRNRHSQSRFDIGFLKTNEIKLQSGATSLFDVRRSSVIYPSSITARLAFYKDSLKFEKLG
jgi:hypothetical protein